MAREDSILDDLGGKPGAIDPPKRRFSRRRDTGAEGRKSPRISDKDLRKTLVSFFSETAPGIAAFAGDEYDANVIRHNAERLADSYIALADSSPRFRALLEAAASAGGPFAGAVFATVAVALPILHHHRVISLPPMFGLALIGTPLETHPEPGKENGHGTADTPEPDGSRVTADAV